jgi:hypothetical protein
MRRLHRVTALAGCFFQSFRVGNRNVSAAVADRAGLLNRMRDDRNRVASHAYRSREKFLGQRQYFVTTKIARVQQPSRQPRLDRVRGIASDGLLRRLIDKKN